MADALEVWWSDNYAKFSISNLEAMEIYSKFQSAEEPFYHQESESQHESFNVSAKSRQYTSAQGSAGEKLTLYPESATWKYENWNYSPELAHTWKTWKNESAEWGLVANAYPEKLVKESWKKEGTQRVYEMTTVVGKETGSTRCGVNECDGKSPEAWTEKIFRSPDETRLERTWSGHNGSGTEIRGCIGDRHYGEISIQSSSGSEKKRWTIEGDCEKGTCTGENAAVGRLTHKWHRDGQSVNEEHTRKPPSTTGEQLQVTFQPRNGKVDDSESRAKIKELETQVTQLKAVIGVNRAWMRGRMAEVCVKFLGEACKLSLKEVFEEWHTEAAVTIKPTSPRSPIEEQKLSPSSPKSPQGFPEAPKDVPPLPSSPPAEVIVVPPAETAAVPAPPSEEAAAKKAGAKKAGIAPPAAAKKSGSNTPVVTQPSVPGTPNPKKAGTPPAAAAPKKSATLPAKKAGAKK